MKKEELYAQFKEKYADLQKALTGTDETEMKKLALEVHAMVHPAEISGRTEKTIADYVLEYMLAGNQNAVVPREDHDVDLHYAGTNRVPLCWQLWHTYRIEDLVSNILMANQDQIFNTEWQQKIGAPIADTGNALTFEEAVAFGKKLNVFALRDYIIEVGKNTRRILESLTLEEIQSMVPEEWVGDADTGRGRCDYGFPFRVAAGILGKADERRYDFNAHDQASYDAFAALPESSADIGKEAFFIGATIRPAYGLI